MTYRLLFYCCFVGLVGLAASCNNDDEDNTVPEPDIQSGFWYDGANFTAPVLPQGIYETAASFSAGQLGGFAGTDLVAIHIFLFQRPFNTEIRVYEAGSSGQPGSLLYSEAINRSTLSENGWTRIPLDTPLPLDGDGLWISFRFEHGGTAIQSLGCDAGPRSPDGDRFFTAGAWTTFNAFANGESINWNIRAEVE